MMILGPLPTDIDEGKMIKTLMLISLPWNHIPIVKCAANLCPWIKNSAPRNAEKNMMSISKKGKKGLTSSMSY